MAKINAVKGSFSFRKHLRNAYILLAFLVLTSVIMGLIFYKNYNLSLWIVLIYCLAELVGLILYPLYRIKMDFLQLNYSPVKATSVKVGATVVRLIFSFAPTPFNMSIGQLASMAIQTALINTICGRNYKTLKDGTLKRKTTL